MSTKYTIVDDATDQEIGPLDSWYELTIAAYDSGTDGFIHANTYHYKTLSDTLNKVMGTHFKQITVRYVRGV